MDLTTLTMDELSQLVEAEKARRRDEARASLEEIAAKHGYTLDELIRPRPKRGYTRNRVTNLPYGQLSREVIAMLREGKSVKEIRSHFGIKNTGAIYAYAKRAGIVIRDGKVVAQ